jgi:Right handed beta helix region
MTGMIRNSILFIAALMFVTSAAHAQVARVFLSGTGNDAGDCTNAATPCRSLQGAVNQTPLNGEIIVVSSGGFGTASITRGLTIDAPSGVVAFNARTINVNVPASQTVTIRGLSMNGAAFGDFTGISGIGAGTLVIEKCIVGGFSYGVWASGARTIISNSEFRNNTGDGVRGDSDTPATLAIENCRFENNTSAGVQGWNHMSVVVRNSVSANNDRGVGFYSDSSPNSASMLVDHCVLANNANGVFLSAPAGTSIVRVSDSSIYGSTAHAFNSIVSSGGTASVISFGNNRVYDNTADETFTSVISTQ